MEYKSNSLTRIMDSRQPNQMLFNYKQPHKPNIILSISTQAFYHDWRLIRNSLPKSTHYQDLLLKQNMEKMFDFLNQLQQNTNKKLSPYEYIQMIFQIMYVDFRFGKAPKKTEVIYSSEYLLETECLEGKLHIFFQDCDNLKITTMKDIILSEKNRLGQILFNGFIFLYTYYFYGQLVERGSDSLKNASNLKFPLQYSLMIFKVVQRLINIQFSITKINNYQKSVLLIKLIGNSYSVIEKNIEKQIFQIVEDKELFKKSICDLIRVLIKDENKLGKLINNQQAQSILKIIYLLETNENLNNQVEILKKTFKIYLHTFIQIQLINNNNLIHMLPQIHQIQQKSYFIDSLQFYYDSNQTQSQRIQNILMSLISWFLALQSSNQIKKLLKIIDYWINQIMYIEQQQEYSYIYQLYSLIIEIAYYIQRRFKEDYQLRDAFLEYCCSYNWVKICKVFEKRIKTLQKCVIFESNDENQQQCEIYRILFYTSVIKMVNETNQKDKLKYQQIIPDSYIIQFNKLMKYFLELQKTKIVSPIQRLTKQLVLQYLNLSERDQQTIIKWINLQNILYQSYQHICKFYKHSYAFQKLSIQ